MSYSFTRGSQWNKWDLHFHTPGSFEYENQGVTNQKIVEVLLAAGVRVVSITDHHKMDVPRLRELQELGRGRLTIFPGIELRDDHGRDPIHYICIFPEDSDLAHLWTTIQGSLGLTAPSIAEKGGDESVYVPIKDAARVVRSLRGIVSIHAGQKSNSIEGIRNREQFQQRIKYDITREYVDILEIGQIKDIERYQDIIFPATGLDKPLVICSDNHDAAQYRTKASLWCRADPTFYGLLMLLREPNDRVFIGDRPPDLDRVERNRTKFIRSIAFKRDPDAPPGQEWFDGVGLEFNHGLIAVIGNKGSGKSALTDTIGLLGATRNSADFSFLNGERFRHPKGGLASHFMATLEWESGDPVIKRLSDEIRPEETERVKYLPQRHVESVCNEIGSLGEHKFEDELKAVIFSHVPDTERLGQASLEDLVQFRTEEKARRVRTLQNHLQEATRKRVQLETQADPAFRLELTEKIVRKNAELNSLESAKPPEVKDPSVEGVASYNAETLFELNQAEESRKTLREGIEQTSERLRAAERRYAVANRLLERLENLTRDLETFLASVGDDLKELGLAADSVVKFTIDLSGATTISDDAVKAVREQRVALDSVDPPGIRAQLERIEGSIRVLRASLDAPSRAYHAYVAALGEWETRRTEIIGKPEILDSLLGMQAALQMLDQLPALIEGSRQEQRRLGLEIHAEKLSQATVYRTLYDPVQRFIDAHPLARGKLGLEFRVELSDQGFTDRLLELLALNRKGTFMGIDEGRAAAAFMAKTTQWDERESVEEFFSRLDEALHRDQREGQGSSLQLKDQLVKGRRPEDVYNLLYSLDFIRPRYILNWEGKEISLLSPGERGILLLIFYLLVDRDDIPLVIDQPEGNLDNHTVAKILVDCIRETRQKRQVFIVTHNPNLAVVCDADQIVHASIDKEHGNAVLYSAGSLENPAMSRYVTDVLEGTRWAFGVRRDKYQVCPEQDEDSL